MLKKSPGFAFVAVLSLALGIGANTAIFTIINAVFLHPLPVEEPSRLAEVFTRDTLTVDANTNFQLTGSSLPNYEDYRDQNTVFSGLALVTFPLPLNWGGQAEPQQLNASLASGNFFDVLGVKPYRGRTFIADGDKRHTLSSASRPRVLKASCRSDVRTCSGSPSPCATMCSLGNSKTGKITGAFAGLRLSDG